MPRSARLDGPGVVHHVIIRGIERRKIFKGTRSLYPPEPFKGKGGIWVLNPEGERLGVISVPELPANLCWGDRDWKTLFITARTSVYRICLNIAGVAVF